MPSASVSWRSGRFWIQGSMCPGELISGMISTWYFSPRATSRRYLVLRVVAPGVGLGVGVALHLQFEQQLVELVVRHVAYEVLQPGRGDVDVAGADADTAFLVLGHVDRAPGGHAVAPGEELEEGPGTVEGTGLGRGGHQQAFARAQFVALRAEPRQGGVDADHDVTRVRALPHDGNGAVALPRADRRRGCPRPGVPRGRARRCGIRGRGSNCLVPVSSWRGRGP